MFRRDQKRWLSVSFLVIVQSPHCWRVDVVELKRTHSAQNSIALGSTVQHCRRFFPPQEATNTGKN
jgi:hypothetical protein